MQSPPLEAVLPQFSSVTLSDAVRLVQPTRLLPSSNAGSAPGTYLAPGTYHDRAQESRTSFIKIRSSSSHWFGSRTSSAFVPLSFDGNGRDNKPPSCSFSHIDSSIHFPSFEKDASDCDIHSLYDIVDANDGFFLLSPGLDDCPLDDDDDQRRKRGGDHGDGDISSSSREQPTPPRLLDNKISPTPRGESTRTLRKRPKLFLQPRIKKHAIF